MVTTQAIHYLLAYPPAPNTGANVPGQAGDHSYWHGFKNIFDLSPNGPIVGPFLNWCIGHNLEQKQN